MNPIRTYETGVSTFEDWKKLVNALPWKANLSITDSEGTAKVYIEGDVVNVVRADGVSKTFQRERLTEDGPKSHWIVAVQEFPTESENPPEAVRYAEQIKDYAIDKGKQAVKNSSDKVDYSKYTAGLLIFCLGYIIGSRGK